VETPTLKMETSYISKKPLDFIEKINHKSSKKEKSNCIRPVYGKGTTELLV
jgi:hypothetical protein